jgi:hypothetical protein
LESAADRGFSLTLKFHNWLKLTFNYVMSQVLKIWRINMSALINYTTIAFTSEFEMNEMIKHLDNTSKVWAPEMKKRGLKRFVCTRIWNKGDTFKLGILFEYDTKEAFQANVAYLDEQFNTLPKTKELMTMAKMEGSRGISVFEA